MSFVLQTSLNIHILGQERLYDTNACVFTISLLWMLRFVHHAN